MKDPSCTCERYGWPDLRHENQHCPVHYHECGCPESDPTDKSWCRYMHCPRKEKRATSWKLFVPYVVPEDEVRRLVEDAGGTFHGRQTYRTGINKAVYHFDGAWAVAGALVALDKDYEAYPR